MYRFNKYISALSQFSIILHCNCKTLSSCLRITSNIRCHLQHFSSVTSVTTFGELLVRTKSACHVKIWPVNPQLCPDQNELRIQSHCDASNAERCIDVTCDVQPVKQLSRVCLFPGPAVETESNSCDVQVPVKYNVDAEVCSDRNVSISSLVNDSLKIAVDTGLCLLNNIQTGQLSVRTSGGDIVSDGLLQGNASLQSRGNGSIRLNKPLCQTLNIHTQRGDVDIQSLYADKSEITTEAGSVHIGSAHRSVRVTIVEHGSLLIDSLDGSLTAKLHTGNVSVYIDRHDDVIIDVESGNIVVKVPVTLMSTVDVIGDVVNIDKQLNASQLHVSKHNGRASVKGVLLGSAVSSQSRLTYGGAQCGADPSTVLVQSNVTSTVDSLPTLRAHTHCGSVQLICQDWITSLNIGKFKES